MEDLNQLEAYDLIPRVPAVQPRWFPFAPFRDPTFQVYQSRMIPLGHTTLDTYVAPGPSFNPGGGNGLVSAIPGNGIVLAGNAPYTGVYTGIQQE
jgi:hypothetical protein